MVSCGTCSCILDPSSPAFLTAQLRADDTLYTNDWVVAQRITDSIGTYCAENLGLPDGEPYRLYKKHGTCLRGLKKEGIVHDRDEFLRVVHDIRLDDCIKPDPALRRMLESIDLGVCSPWVYTASVSDHAERCLDALGISDVLPNRPIIDVRAVGYTTKYLLRQSFVSSNIQRVLLSVALDYVRRRRRRRRRCCCCCCCCCC